MNVKPKAFTFIEVMVALTVVALALSALIRLQIISIYLTDRTVMTTQAVILAEEIMTEITTGSSPSPGLTKGAANRNGRDFYWQSEIQKPNSNLKIKFQPNITQIAGSTIQSKPENKSINFHDLDSFRRVDITVHWLDGRIKKQVQLTSYLYLRNFP